ncbi:MAG: hypothetical protein KDE56_18775 [Anaerolineales bacterium]|nr:hypothetical protein [Anaerolineales bacterium]
MSNNRWQPVEKPYLHYQQDGLLDMMLGLMAILVGIAMQQDLVAVMGVSFLVAYGLNLIAKEWLTAPRLRPEELTAVSTPQIQRTKTRLFTVTLILGLGLFLLTTFLLLNDAPIWLLSTLPAIILFTIIAVLAFMGYVTQNQRLIVYALLILLAFLSYLIVPLPVYIYPIVLGVIILTVGIVLLRQFLMSHPRLAAP